jgi:hypothetical protein
MIALSPKFLSARHDVEDPEQSTEITQLAHRNLISTTHNSFAQSKQRFCVHNIGTHTEFGARFEQGASVVTVLS